MVIGNKKHKDMHGTSVSVSGRVSVDDDVCSGACLLRLTTELLRMFKGLYFSVMVIYL